MPAAVFGVARFASDWATVEQADTALADTVTAGTFTERVPS
jgi:hypothetical protein